MLTEHNALLQNKTWTLVPSNPSLNILGCPWVYRTKFNLHGTFECRKARLEAKGYHRQPGLDYNETFSHIVKPSTIRLIISIVANSGWPLRQLDIENAFLQGELVDIVYMQQPQVFIDTKFPHHVCKLHKASNRYRGPGLLN